ncbi:unnamed protein product [Protopolystoma xenopodis]|uniref:Trichohyalin-plectin-homology domain-containing protein n=1 Tax=Protopolystoma xenopodis TaxID=117903 RepID=A0A448X2Y6_9PLAT|nr:unnamed protein product [Protopolystoma xenopodis]
MREKWRQAEEARLAEENARIRAYMEERNLRMSEHSNQKLARMANMEALQAKLANELNLRENERHEMEEVRQTLAVAEEEAKARNKEAEAWERRLRQRLEILDDRQRSIAEKARFKEVRRYFQQSFAFFLIAFIPLLNASIHTYKYILTQKHKYIYIYICMYMHNKTDKND